MLLAGFVVMLGSFHVLLRRALEPLEHLTAVMQRVDPFTPGQRLEADAPGREVAALTEAFNGMLDRLEGERRRERAPGARGPGGRAPAHRARAA